MRKKMIQKHLATAFQAAPLQYLTPDQMQAVHAASLQILKECGSVVHCEEAVELLAQAGAEIQDAKRVFLPPKLVEESIRSAPAGITICNRDGDPAMALEGTNVYYGTGSDCPNLLDHASGERRDFLYSDVEDSVRLVDALPYLDFTMSNGLAADIDQSVQYQHKYAAMIRNTRKPQVITAANVDVLRDIVDLAACVRGSREAVSAKPLFVLYDEPTSPLIHTREVIEKLLFMAEHRLPMNYAPGMMAGATGPMTVAGAIALANAEILTGLVIHQLKRPGAPFVFGAGMSPIDMQSMQPTYSAPEAMMAQAGLCQIGRSLYNLPTWGFGGCSASKVPDEQAVNEAASYIMMAGWMGTNLVHDVGYLEFGLTYSFEMLMLCNEFIGQVRRMMDGIAVNAETLAVDAVKRVGPGGTFLSDDHTLQYFRDNWSPDLTNRHTFDRWQARGATTMRDRAKQKIDDILANHAPPAFDADVETCIDRILERVGGPK